MKISHLFILVFLATAIVCHAQEPLVLKNLNTDAAARDTAVAAMQAQLAGQAQPQFAPTNVPSSPVAEYVTGDLTELARGLQNDPVHIFNYVHDHIRHVLYFGSEKGAELTYLEKSGNDFDQCALLTALLNAAGYTNTTYQFGWMELPYDSPDHRDLHHWLQLNVTNTSWTNTTNYLQNLFYYYRGYPATAAIWGTNIWGFQRIWVVLNMGGTNYYLDPSFKVSEPIAGINIQTATGFSSNSLMSSAGGTASANSVSNLNEGALRSTLTTYTTNLLNFIQSNAPNASVAQILSGWQIVPSTANTLPTNLPFTTYTWGGTMPILSWQYEPTNMMASMNISFEGTNFQSFIPQLRGQRLTMTYYVSFGYDYAQLWQEDTNVASALSFSNTVTISVNHPVGYWSTNNNTFIDTTTYDQSTVNSYNATSAEYYDPDFNAYNISYAFDPDWGWLQAREDYLDYLRQYPLADDSFDVVAETLNVMALQFQLQLSQIEQIAAAQSGMLTHNVHLIGRLAQEPGEGYYFDFFLWNTGNISASGVDAASLATQYKFTSLANYFGSAAEHGVIEQLQNAGYVAGSTVKMLEIANTNGQAVFLANSNNWNTNATLRNQISGYNIFDLNLLDAAIAAGDTLLLPQYGANFLNPSLGSSWHGYGYVDHVGPGSSGMYIKGQYYGGAVSDPNATVNPPFVSASFHAQPRHRAFRVRTTGGDPVDTASGGFQVDQTDLSLGQTEPRGITFGRFYNSTQKYINAGGMAPGWTHNYNVRAQAFPAPQAGLGGSTPAQMAPMIAATCAALGLYNDSQPDPKNWTVTALIAKWALDQLNQKGVSVQLGKDILQFVQQPDSRFTPPANCTWSLAKPSNYVLQERQGNTFNFDSLGRLTNIVDQYNEPLTLKYNSSSFVTNITDWKGRSLTLAYAGSQLTSVSDSTGRSVLYGYGTNGDLNSVTDAAGKTNKCTYDSDHQIIATIDALNQLLITNIYDPYGYGRVYTQYSQGNLNKAWQVYWSDWQTVIKDPAGGKQQFNCDDAKHLVGFQDALGNLSQTFFDGQDHLIMTVSPLNETNLFTFDANHNLVQTVDALNNTNQFVYDAQNNLIRMGDPRGNSNSFGYNAKFQLTGMTNGAGNAVTSVYNSTDGTLATRTDAIGTTTYGYDSYGQLNLITFPGGLGSEGFLNSTLGDVLSHTNARTYVTSFQYNERRQLTNSIAPTNLTVGIAFDAVGNVSSIKDARGYTVSNLWSPTRKLLATILPSTPQGVPVVTNIYDSRDWLTQTLNPLQQPSQFTNDLAGRLIAATDPVSRTTTFGYDFDGRRITSTNAALEAAVQQWSARGELTKLTDPATNIVLRAFDSVGNQTLLTNRNSKVWQFQFDSANRLTNTISPLNRQTKQSWNSRALLQSFADPMNQTTSFGYDALGRLTSRTDLVAATSFVLDANGNLATNSENGQSLLRTFDAYDRVTSYTDAAGNLIQYRYDFNGNLTNLIYPGNRPVFYFYDSLNRLTNVTDWANRQTSITYDLASRVKSIVRPNLTVLSNYFDAAGEPTNIIDQAASRAPICFFKLNFNSAARVQWEFSGPLPQPYTPPSRTDTFDDDNRLATVNGQNVTNDNNGNMTYGPLPGGTFASYQYDSRNRLLSAGGLNYAYDPGGNRIAVTNGANAARFVINPNALLPQVLMRIRGSVTNYYVYGLGLLYEVDETATTTNTLTYHYDSRGSTAALTDGNGNITDKIQYSAYGMIGSRVGTNDTPFLFNGRYGVQTDANGLMFMRARYYNPYICRFINPDPAGFAGGLNLYAFADGNPVSLLDPFGLGAIEGWGGATATWLGRNVVNPLNSVSTTSTIVNYYAYNAASLIGGLADLLRLGQGTGDAVFNAHSGWDVTIGVTQDIQRAAGITTLVGGGLEASLRNVAATSTEAATVAAEELGAANTFYHYSQVEIPAGQGLKVGSGVTSVGDLNAQEAMLKLGIPPPKYVYPVTLDNPLDHLTIDLGTPSRNAIPSWEVIKPTPPGSVGTPIPVPRGN